ncbi:unnamed protein product [Durusdinium trenchii]|uniref:Dolichyl-phosphate-mannose--protein mannosyltransferase n=1 Tax=Durusdinium trenchii TaxID=1381693 RepID=A0ABP0KHJ8_9DINO
MWCRALGLLAPFAALAAFHPNLHGAWEFVWDDTENFNDAQLRRLKWSISNVQWWCENSVLRVYEPLALAFKATAAELVDLDPKNLHMLQVISHAVLAFVAFLGTKTLTENWSTERPSPSWTSCAALGASSFAVHPLCVQVVCWSSCLPYIWSATLAWLSLIAFDVALENRKNQRYWQALLLNLVSAIAFFGATLCKAVVLFFPVLLTLLRVTKTNRTCDKLPFEVVHWLLALRSGLWALQAASDSPEEVQTTAVQLNMVNNFLRASISVFLYLWRIIIPKEGLGMLFYPVAGGLTSWQIQMGYVAVGLLVCLTLSSIAILGNKKSSRLSSSSIFGAVWISYLALLFPCLQLIQHGDPVWLADRYGFLPWALLGPPLVCIFSRKLLQWSPPLLLAICPLNLLLLGLQSSRLCEHWRNGVQLWSFAVAASAQEPFPAFHHQLGVSLLASGRTDEAAVALQSAWHGRSDALTAKALGRLEAEKGHVKKGLQWLRTALDRPGLSTSQAAATYHDMAVLESRLKRPKLQKILDLYNQSLQLHPDRPLTQER